MSRYLGVLFACLFSSIIHGSVNEQKPNVNQFGEEYLDLVGNGHYHTPSSLPRKNTFHKPPYQQGDRAQPRWLKLLKLNPNKDWDNTQSQHLQVAPQGKTDDFLMHQVPAHLRPNIAQVAEANSMQNNLHTKTDVQESKAPAVKHIKSPLLLQHQQLQHQKPAADLLDVNPSAFVVKIPKKDQEVQKQQQQHKPQKSDNVPEESSKHDVTSENPSAERQRQKLDNYKYVPMYDVYFIAIVAGCSVAGLVGIIVAAVCWYRLQKSVKAASEVDYPAYGVTGPNKERLPSPGDRKLAQSAQMYHYQHQKQQMIALEKANGEMKHDASDDDSEEENEEGDYTVYECPGLAPTGEMEVKNPLFNDESSQMNNSVGNGTATGVQQAEKTNEADQHSHTK